jgi:hypothetical protein
MRLSFFYPNLPIGFDEPARDFWLVDRADALAVAGDGDYERMNDHEAARALFAARLSEFEIEDFLLRVSARNSLFEASAPSLAPRLRLERLVASGDVVAMRQPEARKLDQDRKRLREEREVARDFVQVEKTTPISAGRRLLLVCGADYDALPNRDNYRVLGRAEATRLLSSAVAAPGVATQTRVVLEKALSLLAPDWRQPQLPHGLVLLREMPRQVASQKPLDVVTPSQIRAMLRAEESVSLEVVVLGLDDQPLEGIKYTIDAPDNETYEGDLGRQGKTQITSGKKGTAAVTLAWSVEAEP